MPAPTIFWSVDADGSWANTGDWNLGRLPNASDDVAIDTVHLHAVTHFGGTDSVHTLTVGDDDFIMSGGTLSVASTSSFTRVLSLSGGTLALGGAATVSGFKQGAALLSGAGSLTVTGSVAISGTAVETGAAVTKFEGSSSLNAVAFDLDGGRVLENAGTFTVSAGRITLGFNPLIKKSLGGGVIKNDAGALFDIKAPTTIAAGAGAVAFNNAGTLEQTVTTGKSVIAVPLSGIGVVSVQSGTLEFDGGASLSIKSVTVAAGATLDVGGATFTLSGGSLGGAGILAVSGGTLAFAGAATVANFTQSGGTVSGSTVLTVSGAANLTCTFAGEIGSGATLLKGATTFAGGNLGFDGGRLLENQGHFVLTGGNITLGDNEFSVPLGDGTILNDAGGTFDFQGSASILRRQGVTSFVNAGTLEKTAGTGGAVIDVPFTDTGVIAVKSGTLEFRDGGSAAANAFTVAAGATLAFGGGTFTVGAAGLDLVAQGGVTVGAGSLVMNAELGVAGRLTVSGGTLALGANPSQAGSFIQTGGLLSGTSTLLVTGAADLTCNFATEAGSGTTLLQHASTFSGGQLGLDGGRILEIQQQTFTLTGGAITLGNNNTDPPVGGGEILIDKDGVMDFRGAAAIRKRTGAVSLVNAGRIQKTAGADQSTIDVPLSNTGQIFVSSGQLLFSGGGGAAAGAFTVTSTGTLGFAGNDFTLGAGAFSIAGGLSLFSSTLAFGGAVAIGGLLTVAGGTLALGANAATVGSFAQGGGGGTVSGSSTLTVTGAADLTCKFAAEIGSGTTLLKGATTFAGGNLGLDGGRVLENQGHFVLADEATLNLGNNELGLTVGDGSVRNDAGGVFELQGVNEIARRAGVTAFVNAGTLQRTGTGSSLVDVALTNTGSVLVTGGRLNLSGGLTNLAGTDLSGGVYEVDAAATLELAPDAAIVSDGATLVLSGADSVIEGFDSVAGQEATLESTLASISATGTLAILAGRDYAAAGALTSAGTIQLGGGTLTTGLLSCLAGSSLTGFGTVASVLSDAGAVTAAGGALAFTGDADTFAGVISGGEVDFAGGGQALNSGAILSVATWAILGGTTVSVNDNLSFGGAVSQAAGTTITVAVSDTLKLNGQAALSGTVNGAGALVLSNAAVSGLTIGGVATLDVVGTVDQTGDVTVGDATANSATLSIEAGAVWRLDDDGGIGRGHSARSRLVNSGLLIKSGGAGRSLVRVKITNDGTLVAAGGVLAFSAAVVGAGALVADAGATLEFDRSAAKGLSMTFAGPGAVLALARPSKFKAAIGGFSAGDTLHLLGVNATRADLGANDTLVIKRGAKTIATLQLVGDYTGDTFSVTSDGAGGSDISVDAPATRQSASQVFIGAMAGLGGRVSGSIPTGEVRPVHGGALARPHAAAA